MFKTLADYPIENFEYKKPEECALDFSSYLARFRKKLPPNVLRKPDFSSYKIFLSAGRGWGHGIFGGTFYNGLYSDADYLFVLGRTKRRIWQLWKFKTSALACVGFDIDIEKKTVYIMQIQGMKWKSGALKFLKWERMLVAMVVDWAHAHGFEKACILKAEKNRWWSSDNVKKQQRFKMHYDVTAKRSGFKFCPEEKGYIKQLATVA